MKRFYLISLVLTITVLLSACDTLPKFQDRPAPPADFYSAGRVHLAVSPAQPWYEIRDKFRPNFSVKSADELKDDVLPIVSKELSAEQIATATRLGLSLGGKSIDKSAVSNTIRNVAEDGIETSTTTESFDRTEALTSGAIPDTTTGSGASALLVPASTLNIAESLGLNVDPKLRTDAQNALFFHIQSLNTALDGEIAGEGETPYLVKAQISVQPFSRDIPYDVYSEIFVPSNSSEGRYRIIPLIISDNVQRSAERNLANAAKQLEASVDALVAGKGVGLGRNQIRQQLRDLQAYELNTSFMSGQSDERELTVRIGAPKSPSGSYQMSARTYTVSFILVLPSNLDESEVRIQQYASMRNVRTGKRLPAFSRESKEEEVERIINVAGSRLAPECQELMRYNLKDNVSRGETAMSSCVRKSKNKRNKWYSSSAANGYAPGFLSRFDIKDDSEIYQLLRDFFEASRPSKITIPIYHSEFTPPPSQTAILTDTGGQSSTITLASSKKLNALRQPLVAKLEFYKKDSNLKCDLATATVRSDLAETTLLAKKVSADGSGNISLVFPSPVALGLLPKENDEPCLSISWEKTPSISGKDFYPTILNKSKLPAQNKLFAVQVLPALAGINDKQTAKVRVVITTKPCNPKLECPTVSDYLLTMSDYPIASVAKSGVAETANFDKAKNALVMSAGMDYELTFENVLDGATAKLKVIARDAAKKPVNVKVQFDNKEIKFKAAPKAAIK
ncbi:MAG: hypothetical protein ABJN69_02970 [Hellea sp.]